MEGKTDIGIKTGNTDGSAPVKDPAVKKARGLFKNKKKTPGGEFKKSKKMSAKKLVLLILIVAVVAGGGYGIYKLFIYKEPEQVVTGVTKTDSITTVIEGSATTTPKKFQNLTIPVAGTVKEVYVKQGDTVAVGDKLYAIDTTSLQENIASVNSQITGYETQLATYEENIANQTITAPFSGKLTNVTTLTKGDDVNSNATLATLVDDSTMKLSLYFSKAYLGKIAVGQTADISIPDLMSHLAGTVSAVDNVSYITDEGTECFKVTISITNPGSLKEGQTATATVSASGVSLSPAESGTLKYNQSKTITTKVSGTLSKLNIEDSQRVTSGTVLAYIENDDYSRQVQSIESNLSSAETNLSNLQTELDECSPTATVAGTVIFVKISAGDSVESGTTAMAVYNTDVLQVVADINESQNDYIKTGMTVSITKSGSSTKYTGTITAVSLSATASNGVAYFPTTIEITNDGTLSPGVYVNYSITAAQASDAVLAPIAAVKQTSKGTCLFIKADKKPDNAIDLDDGVVPDGFYAVKVETGLTSNDYVQITSGVESGVTVYESTITKTSSAGSDQTSKTSAAATSSTQQQMGPPGGMGGSMGGGPGGN